MDGWMATYEKWSLNNILPSAVELQCVRSGSSCSHKKLSSETHTSTPVIACFLVGGEWWMQSTKAGLNQVQGSLYFFEGNSCFFLSNIFQCNLRHCLMWALREGQAALLQSQLREKKQWPVRIVKKISKYIFFPVDFGDNKYFVDLFADINTEQLV